MSFWTLDPNCANVTTISSNVPSNYLIGFQKNSKLLKAKRCKWNAKKKKTIRVCQKSEMSWNSELAKSGHKSCTTMLGSCSPLAALSESSLLQGFTWSRIDWFRIFGSVLDLSVCLEKTNDSIGLTSKSSRSANLCLRHQHHRKSMKRLMFWESKVPFDFQDLQATPLGDICTPNKSHSKARGLLLTFLSQETRRKSPPCSPNFVMM